MTSLRISLTISGAVALGAYEGGALAALLYAARSVATGDDPPLSIDIMSGASAGSITALLAARTLLEGHDPRAVMSGAWVERDSIGTLLAHDEDAPLSIEALRATAHELLDPQGPVDPAHQSEPVRLSYTLACLRGLEYRLPRLGRDPVFATTYVDRFEHSLAAGDGLDSLTTPEGASPLDAALASAANAMGFPPYLLDRSAVWDQYLHEGVHNLPPDPNRSLWFTDGGTLDNEPLGRTLDLTNAVDADAERPCQRLHLLIHPHPTAAIHDASWADPDAQPTFVQTAVRALDLQRTQSLYADLKQVEKTNSRISWTEVVNRELGPVLDGLPESARDVVRAALARAIDSIAQDTEALREQRAGAPTGQPSARTAGSLDTANPSELLARALGKAGGLGDKSPARVDVISPLLLDDSRTNSVERLLSGEVLFHFGGFLDRDMRQSDFDLGYASTMAWLSHGGLTAAGLPEELAEQARVAAADAYQPGSGWKETGSATVGSLLRMHPWQAARLSGKITQVLLHDFLHHTPQ